MWNKSTGDKGTSQPVSKTIASTGTQMNGFGGPQEAESASARMVSPKVDSARASRIGSGIKIHGDISGESDLHIDGETQGKIHLAGARVKVGTSGRVEAEIEAREIAVEGTVKGSLAAGEFVRLGATSKVRGTVVAPRVGIDEGAEFHGKVEVQRPEPAREATTFETAVEDEALGPVTAGTES